MAVRQRPGCHRHDAQFTIRVSGRGERKYAQFVRLANVTYPTDATYPNGRKLDYNYANAVDQIMSRLSNITDDSPTQQLAAYTYLGANAIASETFPQPGISLDYSAGNFAALDRFGRVQDQAWKQSGTSLDEYTYLYNAAGDRTSRSNALTYLLNEGYTYDALHRLTQWNVNNSPQETWSLDALGNMLSNKGTAEQFDPANEITSINGSAALRGYDLAGNMTTTPQPGNTSAAYTCTFDAWNRLAMVTNGGTTNVTYSYDGTGRLVVTAVGGGATTYSYYDGQNAIETRVNGTGASSVQYQYVYSPLGAGKTPILRDDFTTGAAYPRLYYLADANTNVTAVVGYSGSTWQVAERYVYDPYGTVTYYSANWTSSPGPLLTHANTVLYASMVLDQTTDLYYDEARWYSTAVSTFISTDPAQADLNTYRYCGNAPTDGTDPSGRASYTEIGGDLFYTWDMGWLDKSHMGKHRDLIEAWNKLKAAKTGEQNLFILLSQSQANKKTTGRFCITPLPTEKERKAQLLHAWQGINEAFERYQGKGIQGWWAANQIYGWFIGQWDKQGSSFSTEDLVSDLVGFYAVVEDKDPMQLVNQYARRFDEKDEKSVSQVIWGHGLACTSGNGGWTPVYFNDEGFVNDVLRADDYYKTKSMQKLRDTAAILMEYRRKYGKPTFPAFFQQYTPTTEGFTMEYYWNK